MSAVLGTERIGQLTGVTRTSLSQDQDLTTDWQFWPLLNQTGRWGVNGIDLGANTEHNGLLYIFFGDVAIPNNPDAVCWTSNTVIERHGGHLALGWDFRLPNDHQGATQSTGQWDWRLCGYCHGLFWCPDFGPAGVCPSTNSPDGMHQPVGWNFVLPNNHQGATDATGQRDWWHCAKCDGLFFAPNGDASQTACPAGGSHDPADSWLFYLPARETGASESSGQPQWRFCANCHALFWNGDSIKGLCPNALGGGFRLDTILDQSGQFVPFEVDQPIGFLGPFETPTGAFSHAGRAYVFIWVGPRDDQSAAAGSYLTSKDDPSAPGTYRIEQLISPLDSSNTAFSQIAAVWVDNAAFPGVFPSSTGAGVVLFGQGNNARLGNHDAIHLAWSALADDPDVGPLSMLYYTGDAGTPWSANPNDAFPLLPRQGYTSVSAGWLPGPQRWILIYGTANPIEKGGPVDGPVMARLGRTPFELASAPDLKIFDPGRENAYRNYMHKPGCDSINPELPPSQPPPQDTPGWAYGAHLLNRFTQWDPDAGLIRLYYLMSTASPYQVQLMHTVIRFA